MTENKPIDLNPYIEANRKVLRLDRLKKPRFSVALPPIDIFIGKEIVVKRQKGLSKKGGGLCYKHFITIQK